MSMTRVVKLTFLLLFYPLLGKAASAQAGSATSSLPDRTSSQLEVDQVSDILDLTASLRKLQVLQAQRGCHSSVASLEELNLRQHLLESVQTASLDIDGVMGTISNERGKLSNLQTSLKTSRDKTVARLNAAALITGSGLGAAVSATQFTRLGSQTNNVGDGIGIGSGTASTLLAYLAIRKQHGPDGTVANVSNMLAPLFDRPSVLNTNHPSLTLRYLESVPRGRLQNVERGWNNSRRSGQRRAVWIRRAVRERRRRSPS